MENSIMAWYVYLTSLGGNLHLHLLQHSVTMHLRPRVAAAGFNSGRLFSFCGRQQFFRAN